MHGCSPAPTCSRLITLMISLIAQIYNLIYMVFAVRRKSTNKIDGKLWPCVQILDFGEKKYE